MELNFPHKNTCVQVFLGYAKSGKMKQFSDWKTGTGLHIAGFWERGLEIVDLALANFDNEIQQVIHTTNQESIDQYFTELNNAIGFIEIEFSKKTILARVKGWNAKSLAEFTEKIQDAEKKYFESPDRKRRHLEEYVTEDLFAHFFLKQPKLKKRINYNLYCAEEQLELIDASTIHTEYIALLDELKRKFYDVAWKYTEQYMAGMIRSRYQQIQFDKPMLFVEGSHDVKYVKRAAELLGYTDLLAQFDIRQRGGASNLDNLWNTINDVNWEVRPRKKIFLYDCDIKRVDEQVGFSYRRTIPMMPDRMIKKGIENLLPDILIEKAKAHKKEFIDITKVEKVTRGVQSITVETNVNKDEKTWFCSWVCENATKEDFKGFEVIFHIMRDVINEK